MPQKCPTIVNGLVLPEHHDGHRQNLFLTFINVYIMLLESKSGKDKEKGSILHYTNIKPRYYA